MSANEGEARTGPESPGAPDPEGEGERPPSPRRPGGGGGRESMVAVPAAAAPESVPGLPRNGPRLATGCGSIDRMLGGGVERGALTELYGEAGSGKTNLCLQLSREAASKGLKVAYVDTEGVSVERLAQMCGERFGQLSRLILFFESYGMEEQEEAVDKATRLCESGAGIGLLVVDSSTIFYRMTLGGDDEGYGRRSLAYQLTRLLNTARKWSVPAIITTQVYFDSGKDRICPIGGHLMDHQAKTILRLEKVGTGVRRATLCKHRSRGEGASCLFYLTDRGVEERPPAAAERGDEEIEPESRNEDAEL